MGLQVQFDRTEDGAQAAVHPAHQFQGFTGVLQGGVVAGLMDDAMWYAIWGTSGTMTMTAEMTVRYKAPVPVDTDLVVTGKVVERRRTLFTAAATICDQDGAVLAEATGKFLAAPRELAGKLAREMA